MSVSEFRTGRYNVSGLAVAKRGQSCATFVDNHGENIPLKTQASGRAVW
jgi:hypothetical protein